MPDTLAGKNINKCPIDDKKVEEKGRFVEVLYIQSKFFLGRDAIPAVHLRPSGNAGAQHVDPGFLTALHDLSILRDHWPRSNDAHVSDKNRVKLRYFVKTAFAKESAKAGYISFRIVKFVRWQNGCVDSHRPQFGHPECLSVFADTR